MLVLLTSSDFGIGYELTPVNKRAARQYERETGHESVLIQSDWDFPGLAGDLGIPLKPAWIRENGKIAVENGRRVLCRHGSTDGTVDCRGCGTTASEFIEYARERLDKREGDVIRADVEAYFGW